jgi:transcription elongation GreA/GreB family factor
MVIGARIASLSRILERARVVTEIADQVGTARIGSTITLRVDGRKVVRSLRGAHETIGRDEMSASSPIGQAVIGRPPGTNVSVEMPNGAFRCVEIVAVVDEDGDQASTRPRRIA